MRLSAAVAMATLASGTAMAGSLDRSNQDIGVLFEEGTHARLSFGYIRPDLQGTDVAGIGTGDVADNYFTGSLGYRQQLSDALSFALIIDQPYGADISYPASSPVLGNTAATLNTSSIAAYLRYEFGNGFSVHGGVRSQKLDANVTLAGAAYGGLNGYNVDLDGDSAFGYQAGVAYERPEIALRVALTYHSEIDHDLDTVENIAPGARTNTDLTTPEALNLDFQTGVAEGTLVFGSVRFARYSDVVLSPNTFGLATGGASLVDIDDALDIRIGVARRITERFAGLASVAWSRSGDDDTVSPLAPSNGSLGLTLGGVFDVTDAVRLTGGINYTEVRDARPETGGVARASFDGNHAVGVGVQLGYTF